MSFPIFSTTTSEPVSNQKMDSNNSLNNNIEPSTETKQKPDNRLLWQKDNFFQAPDDEGTSNGFMINGHVLPTEIFVKILSEVPLSKLLTMSLVCKSWCRIIRSTEFWMDLYNKHTNSKNTKPYPWYVFYGIFSGRFSNMLIYNRRRQNSTYASIQKSTDYLGKKLPKMDVLPLNGCGCGSRSVVFPATHEVMEFQQHIKLDNLLLYIMRKHRPQLYVQSWIAGCVYQKVSCTIKCRCKCKRKCTCKGKHAVFSAEQDVCCAAAGKMLQFTIDEYPINDVKEITFCVKFNLGIDPKKVCCNKNILMFDLNTLKHYEGEVEEPSDEESSHEDDSGDSDSDSDFDYEYWSKHWCLGRTCHC